MRTAHNLTFNINTMNKYRVEIDRHGVITESIEEADNETIAKILFCKHIGINPLLNADHITVIKL